VTTFMEEQTARDDILARAVADGHFTVPGIPDTCRRWSTCDLCGHRSGEMQHFGQQSLWEDDHIIHGCGFVRADVTLVDPDLPLYEWPDHTRWTFTRELLPLLTVHVYRPTSDAFTSHRTPQAMPERRAA